MPKASLAQRLTEIKERYLVDLNSRGLAYRVDPAVRKAKESVLEIITGIVEELPPGTPGGSEPDALGREQYKQIQERLTFLESISFGAATALDNPKAYQFKRSSLQSENIFIGLARNLLSAFGRLPEMHFEDVITNAKAMLRAELHELAAADYDVPESGVLNYSTPEEVARSFPAAQAALQAGRQETMAEAVADFGRGTRLGDKAYKTDEASTAAYQTSIAHEILTFTGEADIDKGYAGAIAHLAGQAAVGVVTTAMLGCIPALDAHAEATYIPSYGSPEMVWSKAEAKIGGYFLDVSFPVVALSLAEDPEVMYSGDKTSSIGAGGRREAPSTITLEEFRARRADHTLPAIVTVKGRVHCTLPEGADRPVLTLTSIRIIDRDTGLLPFSAAAQAQKVGSDPSATAAVAGAGIGMGAGDGMGASRPQWLSSSPADPRAYHSPTPTDARKGVATPAADPRADDTREAETKPAAGPSPSSS